MRNIELLCWAFFGVCFAADFHLLVTALVQEHNWIRMDASAWAAWVQAIGSIAAIIAAIWLMRHQTDAAAKLVAKTELLAQLRTVRTLGVAIEQICMELENAVGYLDRIGFQNAEDPEQHLNLGRAQFFTWNRVKRAADETKNRLIEMPIYTLDSTEMAVAIVKLIGYVTDLQHLTASAFEMITPEEIAAAAVLNQQLHTGNMMRLGIYRSGIARAREQIAAALVEFDEKCRRAQI